jgi:primase-polymerase (primpol)-like protein
MTRPAPARPPRPPLFSWPSDLPAITELAGTPHWVAWRYAWRQERQKWTKPPVNATTGRLASSTDAASWTTLERARAAYEADAEIGGVGFALTHDYAMVDLDDCFDPETGSIVRVEAREVVETLNSYCEITPGGRGLHVVVRGRVPDTLGKRNDKLQVEAYST